MINLRLGMIPSLIFGANKTEPKPYKVEFVKEFVLAGYFSLDKVKTGIIELD
ncbi:hypothetical protein [uncultured Maribacter sp.]|uniref:hypothetical protein n=1 Tax=uncultured Maribacter sp. TaxID=431308 RepID=UPI002634EEDB|nr:hypothetical protein [uncultured Maribacter sp.]